CVRDSYGNGFDYW
nr:immunoglobulin heavy chain junction region [Macaca mulatta]